MSVLFVANVGSSDLQWNDGERLRPPREAGERLLAQWDDSAADVAARLTLPVLIPSLREALAHHERIDRLVLFATDQIDPKFRPTDTLYFAELARRWLQNAAEFAGRLGNVEVNILRDISPATYDSTFAAYAPQIAALATDGVSSCYVAVAGGTAAMNMALLFHAVRVFEARCQAIYKRPDPDEPAFPLDIGDQLRQSVSRQAVVTALKRQDFAAALALMEAAGGYEADLVALVRYAKQRLHFDFDSARRSLSEAIAAGYRRPALRDLATSAIRDLDRLRARDLGARLAELTHNAAVAYQAERYVSFLGRVYRFQEATLRWVMEEVCGLPTDLSPEHKQETLATWQQRVEAHAELLAFLQEQEIDGEPLDYTRIARPTMEAVARFVQGKGRRADGSPYLDKRERGRFYGGLEMLKKFNQLADFRNRTIIAHDFAGVSADILSDKYKGGDPVGDLYQILVKFGVPVGANPFDEVASRLIDEINQLA